MSDQHRDLWLDFIEGNKVAFEQIYRSEVDFLISYGMSLVHDEEVVADGVQELFVDIWNSRNRLSKEVNIRSYLLVSLKRRLLKPKKEVVSLNESHWDGAAEDAQSHLIEKESASSNEKLIDKAIGELSPQQREAIQLRFFQEKSYEEMVEIMGITYQSCRNIVSVAIKQLSHLKEKLII